jgi:hypothetical protein
MIMVLDFKLSPCFECLMFAFGLLPGVGRFNDNRYGKSHPHSTRTDAAKKMERTECSETLAFKLQTPGNNPKANIREDYGCFTQPKHLGFLSP